jgi:hypothetical protein
MGFGYRYGLGVKTDGSYGYGWSWGQLPPTARPFTANDPAAPAPTSGVRRTKPVPVIGVLIGLAVVAAIAVAGLLSVFGHESSPHHGGTFGYPPTNDVAAAVRPGSSWNLRAGPNGKARIVGHLNAGDPVVVHCLNGRWARLSQPQADVYVFADALLLPNTPQPC